MLQYKKLRTTGLGEKFGQTTREDNKTKIKMGLDNNEKEEYLHFVRKWHENKFIKYESNEQDETMRKNRVSSIKMQFENKIEHAILDTGSNISCVEYSLIKNKDEIVPEKQTFITGAETHWC